MSKYFLDSFIKNLREESGLTQSQFAKKLGVGFSTLKQAELGNTSLPKKSFLKALAKYCKATEEEILKYVLYYDYLFYCSSNKDAGTLSLYTAYLFNNGYRLHDDLLFLKKCTTTFKFYLEKIDKKYILTDILEQKRNNPNKLIDIENYLGMGSCLKKGGNPTQLVIPFISYELAFADVKNDPDYFSSVASLIEDSIPRLYPNFKYTKTKVAFVFADPKNLHKKYLDEGFLSKKKNKVANYYFVYVDTNSVKYDVCYSK